MAGVGRGGDDVGFDGGGGHASHEDGRAPGQAGEGGLQDVLPVDPAGARREVRPVLRAGLSGPAGGQVVAGGRGPGLDVGGARPGQVVDGDAGQAGARADVDDHSSGGHGRARLRGPVEPVGQAGAGQALDVAQAASARPVEDLGDGRLEERAVEGGRHVEELAGGLHSPRQGGQIGREANHDHVGGGVDDADRHVLGQAELGRVDAEQGEHGGGLSHGEGSRAQRLTGRGSPQEAGQGVQAHGVRVGGRRAEDPLRVSEGGVGLGADGLGDVEIGAVLGEEDPGHGRRGARRGSDRVGDEVEAAGDGQELGGDGGQERLAGVAHAGEPFRQGRIRDQLGQFGPPGSGLAGEVRDPSLRMLGSHAYTFRVLTSGCCRDGGDRGGTGPSSGGSAGRRRCSSVSSQA